MKIRKNEYWIITISSRGKELMNHVAVNIWNSYGTTICGLIHGEDEVVRKNPKKSLPVCKRCKRVLEARKK